MIDGRTGFKMQVMRSGEKIVNGGGWVTRQRFGRPKARLFTSLSVVWLGVALIALIAASVAHNPGESLSWPEVLCAAAALPLPIFVVLAVVCRLKEQPRHVTECIANPDYDARKLY